MPSDRVPKHKQRLATKGEDGSKVANSPAPVNPKKENSKKQQKKGVSPAGAEKKKIESGDKKKDENSPPNMNE